MHRLLLREHLQAQRSARRECRSRHEADAGHRKRALKPLPGQKRLHRLLLREHLLAKDKSLIRLYYRKKDMDP